MQDYAAIGMLEFTSIAAGIEASDKMVKAAEVIPLFMKTVCPGKFLTAISGDLAAVDTSVRIGCQARPESVADWFVIPNIHPEVVSALSGCCKLREQNALGVIETFSASSAVLAADAAAKTASIQLIDVRTALGLGGKGYVLLTGDVGAVQAAVNAGAELASEKALLVGVTVLPRPDPALFAQLM